ncbi:MAG: YCF48-related protein [Saprospiraceae bacterium]
MKNYLLLLGLFCCFYHTSPAQKISPILPDQMGKEVYTYNYSDSLIWAFFRNGEVQKSIDGGSSWDKIYDFNVPINALYVLLVDSVTLAIKNGNTLFYSEDGGYSWQNQNLQPSNSNQIYKGFGKSLFYTQYDYLYFSSDFFQTYIRVETPHQSKPYYFPDSTHFYLLDKISNTIDFYHQDGRHQKIRPETGTTISTFYYKDFQTGFYQDTENNIYKTENGGQTWEMKFQANENISSFPLIWLFKEDHKKGMLVNQYTNVVFKTDDFGETWYQVTIPFLDLIDVYKINNKTYYRNITGSVLESSDFLKNYTYYGHYDNGSFSKAYKFDSTLIFHGNRLMVSQDNGQSYTVDPEFPYGGINKIEFVNNEIGFLIDRNKKLYRTIDKGNSWQELFRFPTEIKKASYLNEEKMIALDSNNDLWKSLDGGLSWEIINSLDLDYRAVEIDWINEDEIIVVSLSKILVSLNAGEDFSIRPYNSSYGFIGDYQRIGKDSLYFLTKDNILFSPDAVSSLFELNFPEPKSFKYFSTNNGKDFYFIKDTDKAYKISLPDAIYPIPIDHSESRNYFGIDVLSDGKVYLTGPNNYVGSLVPLDKTCSIRNIQPADGGHYNRNTILKWDSDEDFNGYYISLGTREDTFDLVYQKTLGFTGSFDVGDYARDYGTLWFEIGQAYLDGEYLACGNGKLFTEENCNRNFSIESETCVKNPFVFRGQTYPSPGNFEVLIESPNGCDTTFKLRLTQPTLQIQTENLILCPGESTTWKGMEIESEGILRDTVENQSGCDSIRHVLNVFYDSLQPQFWNRVFPNPPSGFTRLFYVNDDYGWAISGNSILYHKNPSDPEWVSINTQAGNNIKDLFFISETKGWLILGNDSIGITEDGGLTWTNVFFIPNSGPEQIFFSSENIGYIIGKDGLTAKTIDGGQSWFALNYPENYDLKGLYFDSDTEGYVYGDQGTIGFTYDGGMTWEIRYPYYQNISSAKSLNYDTIITLISQGIIYTENRGRNWTFNEWEGPGTPTRLVNYKDEKIFVWTTHQILYSSEDFGKTWKREFLEEFSNLNCQFSSPETGPYFQNLSRNIYHYSDKKIRCIDSLENPSSSQLASVFQTFAWSSIYPCVEGYEISLGSGTSTNNLANLRDIGGREFYKNAFPLPFDSDINLSIFPYLEDNQNNTCPPLSFRTCPFIGDSIKVEICQGEVFDFRGNEYTEDTKTYWSWSLPGGCDSFIVLDLKVIPVEQVLIDTTFNKGDSFLGITLQNDTTIYRSFTSSFGCDSFVVYQIMVDKSNIEEPDSFTGIRVFPNPTSGELLVSMSEVPKGIVRAELYNSTGQLVYRDDFFRRPNDLFEMHIPPDLAEGIYILKILFENDSYVEKISLKRP